MAHRRGATHVGALFSFPLLLENPLFALKAMLIPLVSMGLIVSLIFVYCWLER